MESDPSRTRKRSAPPVEMGDVKKEKKKKKSDTHSAQSCNETDMARTTTDNEIETFSTTEHNCAPCQAPGPVTFEVLPEGAFNQLFEGGGMVEGTEKLPADISKSLADYCKYLERFEVFAKAQAGQIEEG